MLRRCERIIEAAAVRWRRRERVAIVIAISLHGLKCRLCVLHSFSPRRSVRRRWRREGVAA